MSRSVLVIDDEATLAKNIAVYLVRSGFDARIATDGAQGLRELEVFKPDIVLLDYQLGDMDGLEVLRQIRQQDTQTKVIVITGHGNVQLAVNVMKAGAYDYLTKPLALAELALLLDKALGQNRVEGTLAYYQSKQAERSGLKKLLGESAPMQALKRKLAQYIGAEQQLQEGTPPAVLITGETGTGKELVARAFHFEGRRRTQPFVEINCASIPLHLMEAELFGYERGAFTDAKERKLGLIETADGGTLFLDEIGELDSALQAKLLRLLEDKRVRRLGGLRDQDVDVRVIAATNRDPNRLVEEGKFRADLLFRLRIISIQLPTLRQRDDDIPLLAKEFLSEHGRRYGKPDLYLSSAAENILRRHSWPGNVRELRNVIEHAVVLAEGAEIKPQHLTLHAGLSLVEFADQDDLSPVDIQDGADLNLERLELDAINRALLQADGNVTRAAQLLGISRDTLRYRLDKYQLRGASS